MLAFVLHFPAGAQARDLTIAVRDAAFLAAVRTAYLAPFTQVTAIDVASVLWDATSAALARLAPGDEVGWDIVELPGSELRAACAAGLVEKLDWAALGGRDSYLPQGTADCGVGAAMSSIVLAWNKDKFPATPTWAEFWDVAKYPGKRGLRAGARTNLEISLLADGVAPADVYAQLRTDAGVERAFRKLDQLKPYVVWWRSGDEPGKLLGLGDVLMTSAPNDRIAEANRTARQMFSIQWNGALASASFWAIPKAAPNRASAYKLLAYMGDPANQARLPPLIALGGLARKANDGLPPALLAESPTNPAVLGGTLMIDEAFWSEMGAKLEPRFDAWAAR